MLFARKPTQEPSERLARLSDEAWLEAMVRSIEQPVQKGVSFPTFPPAEFQVATVGSSGRQALVEAWKFWRIVRDRAGRAGTPIERGRRVLDFGCGWGRMMRFFLRDLPGEDVWGADVGRDMLALCREHFRTCRFELVQPTPPTALPSGSFDVVYAYSVFSHLNEAVSRAWVEEVARVLEPGGLFLATTQARRFITRCGEIRRGGNAANPWEESLGRLFHDVEATLAAYDRGEFVHAPTGGGQDRPATFYGESVIPRGHVERVWGGALELVEFVDDPALLPQALIVMRRRR